MTDRTTHEFNLVDDVPDMHRVLARLRAQSPIMPITSLGEPAYILLTHDYVHAALRDEDTFPSEASYRELLDPVVGRSLNSMKGEEHNRNRALVSPTFRRQRMKLHRSTLLEPLCHRLLDRLERTREANLRDAYSDVFPMMVITSLIGMPADEYETLEAWSNALFLFPVDPDAALSARAELTDFLLGIMASRRATPTDDLVSTLVDGQLDGRTLSDEEILSFLRLLFPAGAHNTTSGIGTLLYAVAGDPEVQERLRAEPQARRSAVEEALRWEPPVGNLPRRANATGTTWGDLDIPAGSAVIFSLAAANRDPAVFDEPDRFDLDRRTDDLLTFGFGEHFCLGAWLAREEMAVALDVLLERTTHIELTDPDRAAPRGAFLRGPQALPVRIDWA